MGNPTTFKGAAQTFNAANQNTQNATLGFNGLPPGECLERYMSKP